MHWISRAELRFAKNGSGSLPLRNDMTCTMYGECELSSCLSRVFLSQLCRAFYFSRHLFVFFLFVPVRLVTVLNMWGDGWRGVICSSQYAPWPPFHIYAKNNVDTTYSINIFFLVSLVPLSWQFCSHPWKRKSKAKQLCRIRKEIDQGRSCTCISTAKPIYSVCRLPAWEQQRLITEQPGQRYKVRSICTFSHTPAFFLVLFSCLLPYFMKCFF